jgi:hypothetical protein
VHICPRATSGHQILLAGGLTAYLARAATPAHSATQTTRGLAVTINPGSTTVGIGTVSTTVTYTCTDTTAPGGQAQLRVDFDQNGNDTSGELAVPCGAADINKTQTVTAVQVGMSGTQEITAIATLDDGTSAVSYTADAIKDDIYTYTSPTVTYPGDGSITLTGFYNCGPDIATPAKLIISATEVGTSDIATAGSALVTIATCNGTDQPLDGQHHRHPHRRSVRITVPRRHSKARQWVHNSLGSDKRDYHRNN